MPSQSRCHLLEAPEDIRRLIYVACVTYPGGLHYDYDSGKLLDNRNTPIDIQPPLARTCKLIASEMEGLVLRSNTIHFKTCYTDIHRHRDRAWRQGLELLDRIRLLLLASAYSSLVATDALAATSTRYPRFHRRFSLIMTAMEGSEHPLFASGITETVHQFLRAMLEQDRQAVAFILRLASTTGDMFRSDADTFLRREFRVLEETLAKDISTLLDSMSFIPIGPLIDRFRMINLDLGRLDAVAVANFDDRRWMIPTDEDITALWSVLGGSSPSPRKEKWALPAMGRVSAAFSAVRFLQSSSNLTRSNIRHMSLAEDREALHENYSHGLIPFCAAHPSIRITRHLYLWRNLYARHEMMFMVDTAGEILATEAGLFQLGMPKESYSVVFEPEEDPIQSTKLFQRYVFKTIAWTRAMVEWDRQQLPALPDSIGQCWEEHIELVEHTIREMAAGRGPIRCNFPCRRLCDPNIALQAIRKAPPGEDLGGVRMKYLATMPCRYPFHYLPKPPLPTLKYMRRKLEDPWPVRFEARAQIRDAQEEYPDVVWLRLGARFAIDDERILRANEREIADDRSSVSSESDIDDRVQAIYADNDQDPMFHDYYVDANDI